MRIFLSAGEASGEQYAVQLMRAFRKLTGQAPEFFGLGGPRMEAAGFDRVVRAEDVAVMGITEIVRHVPRIYREYLRLKRSLAERRPDVAVLIDFPDVNLALARRCGRLGIPVVFFVSPQVWAWKKHRIRQIRANVDQMLVIFPFEEAFYREHGVTATYVGHPLAELAPPAVSRENFATQHGLDAKLPWVALLPGSRPAEIRLNLPAMIEAARELAGEQAVEWLLPLAPTLTPEQQTEVHKQLSGTAGVRITTVRDARAALLHARASVVASGTATVEAALLGNPFLVVYRVSRLTYAIARRVVTVNLVAGRRIVPELIQDDFTPVKVALELRRLLNDERARQSMMGELQRVRELLTSTAGDAVERVAAVALEHMARKVS